MEISKCDALQSVNQNELQSVEGGLGLYTEVSGMPSRDVGGCGTMWILDRMLKGFGGMRLS
ncbi:MAG: hypothetical protein AB7O26_06445 [Planctomycetaceae bacterium]